MSIVAFITRDTTGTNFHGTGSEGNPSIIDAAAAKDISLNLTPAQVESYARYGDNLHIVLNDGTKVVLNDFYDDAATGAKNLFLSENGSFIEVVLEDKADGMLFAAYEPLDLAGKWSAYDDMVFIGVDRIEPVVAPLIAPALGGMGLLGAGAAAAGAAALVGGGDDDDDGGDNGDPNSPPIITPTVDNPDSTELVGGEDDDGVTITGTGEEGSEVVVNIGTTTVTTIIGEGGTWSVNIPTVDMPNDGIYRTIVNVTGPNGAPYSLVGPTIDVDMTPPEVEITAGTQASSDVVNGEERLDGAVISGTGEAGTTVALTIDGETQTTTVGADGTWSVTFNSTQISTGDYTSEITIVTTDGHGNSTTTTDTLVVDTETSVAINSGQAGGDDIATAAELAAGLALTGTAEANATVSVTLYPAGSVTGVTRTATADASGNWSVTYEAGSLPSGEYDASMSVTSTDLAGNSASSTSSLRIDTDAGEVAISDAAIAGDDTINADERTEGVTITGTATAGEEVTVTLGSASATVLADDDGNWSHEFAASDIPEGTGTLAVTATISDELGNTASDSDSVALDTVVTDFASSSLAAEDGTVNLAEMNEGFDLTGTVEAGSSVTVTINGIAREATVDADGNWSVTFDGEALSEAGATRDAFGTYSATATITATDAAGNVTTLEQDISVDTEFDTPEYRGESNFDGEIEDVSISSTEDDIEVFGVAADGAVSSIDFDLDNSSSSRTKLEFDEPVADGTSLIIRGTDDAGNASSTYVVDQETMGTGDFTGLGDYNIDSLKLVFENGTDGSSITLTEDLIKGLSDNSDTLTIRGGDTDVAHEVSVTGALKTGTETNDAGETFDVYTVGDGGARLLVEEDANVSII